MEQNIETQRKKALLELNQANDKTKRIKRRKILIISLIIILILIFIKIVFGTIEINNIFGYPASEARYYKVTVNEKQIPISYTLRHRIPIVPFFLNLNSYYLGNSYIVGDDSNSFLADDSKHYIININSYSCYSNNQKYQVECKNNKQPMQQNNDTKYTNLKIVRTSNPYEEIYNGKLVYDIAPYVEKKGTYYIEITASYSLIETKVYFYFKN